MTLRHLDLDDFRIFRHAHVSPEPEGTTVITGANGSGKTSVLEALGYLGTRRSFRGAPAEALVRTGAPAAIVRAELEKAGSPSVVDAEISLTTRSRIRVNRKAVNGRRSLAVALPCTVFSPEDLTIVSGGPKGRRDLLDDAVGLLDAEGARAADDTERVLRQRAALLRQSGGRPSGEVTATLDVWDQRLADAGKILVAARERVVSDLGPLVDRAYAHIAGAGEREVVWQRYVRSWEGDLSTALEQSRREDLRRGVTTVGPHRDDLSLRIEGREARTHASQGEQRCLALALRLGVHQLVCQRTPLVPILLLDDVFSELDPARSTALVAALPPGQCLVTTAAPLPEDIAVARVIPVDTLESA